MSTGTLFHDLPSTARSMSLTFRSGYYLKQREFEDSIKHALADSGFTDFESISGGFVTFDLSNSYWYDLGTTLWLITLLHKLKKQGNDLQLLLPEPTSDLAMKLWGFLYRWHFFECLDANVDFAVNLLKPSQARFLAAPPVYSYPAEGTGPDHEHTYFHKIKLLEICTLGLSREEQSLRDEKTHARKRNKTTDEFIREVSEAVVINALASICQWTSVDALTFTRKVISESVQNASFHAKGSFSVIAMRIDPGNLTLAIADNGVGIPASLRSVEPKLSSVLDSDLIRQFSGPDWILKSHLDSDWIKHAMRRGVGAAGRPGDGLHYLKSFILDHHGELRVRSGTACVDFTVDKPDGEPRDYLTGSPGTMLRTIIPTKFHSTGSNARRRRR